MKQLVHLSSIVLSVLVLFSCQGSSGSSGYGKAGDLAAACQGANPEEFFAGMSGDFALPAIDSFTLEDPPEETEDDTFVHGRLYKTSFADDMTLNFETEHGALTLTYGEEKTNQFFLAGNVIFVLMKTEEIEVTTRLSCEESGEGKYSFFIIIKDIGEPVGEPPVKPVGDLFYWRLDQAFLQSVL